MKIIIDIPKKDYEKAKRITVSLDGAMQIFTAIAEGKIIPENHGRLIDADKIIKYWKPDHHRQFDADYFIHTLEVADTIIEAEQEETT